MNHVSHSRSHDVARGGAPQKCTIDNLMTCDDTFKAVYDILPLLIGNYESKIEFFAIN